MVPVQTGSETVSGNMGMPRPGTKWSGVFGKIPDRDRDRGVWSGSDRVPIGLGPNFPNTTPAPSPNEDVAPGSTTIPPYPMPGGRTSQDRPPATDVVSGGPSTVLAAALNDKLDQIAQ